MDGMVVKVIRSYLSPSSSCSSDAFQFELSLGLKTSLSEASAPVLHVHNRAGQDRFTIFVNDPLID